MNHTRSTFAFSLAAFLLAACGGAVGSGGTPAGSGGSGGSAEISAQPFPCGDATCSPGQYCESRPAGSKGPDGNTPPATNYNCEQAPAECGGFPTCACVTATLSPDSPCSPDGLYHAVCQDDGTGGVTLFCVGV